MLFSSSFCPSDHGKPFPSFPELQSDATLQIFVTHLFKQQQKQQKPRNQTNLWKVFNLFFQGVHTHWQPLCKEFCECEVVAVASRPVPLEVWGLKAVCHSCFLSLK